MLARLYIDLLWPTGILSVGGAQYDILLETDTKSSQKMFIVRSYDLSVFSQ